MTRRISLVTGTSGGLGFELVNQLSAKPDSLVFALTRNPLSSPKLQVLASERNNLVLVKADMTNDRSMKDAFEIVAKILGERGIDLLIANAGAASPSGIQRGVYEMAGESFTSSPLEDFSYLFDVNVMGSIRTVNVFLPLIKKGNEKKITIISTISGSCTLASLNAPFDPSNLGVVGPYAVSKAALNMAGRKYAVELHKDGITVVTVSPGWVKTNLSGTDIATLEAPAAMEKLLKAIDAMAFSDSGRFFDVAEDKDCPF
ncbi:NAD(P)-binding protein [Atractiella rhizophila]|nr:NAD(P)-binding protein [Atractiella rhizophila]